MALDPSSVGAKGEPSKRSWTSKDSLLYAVGVGAGTSDGFCDVGCQTHVMLSQGNIG